MRLTCAGLVEVTTPELSHLNFGIFVFNKSYGFCSTYSLGIYKVPDSGPFILPFGL